LQYCIFVELKFFYKLQIMLKNHTKSYKKSWKNCAPKNKRS